MLTRVGGGDFHAEGRIVSPLGYLREQDVKNVDVSKNVAWVSPETGAPLLHCNMQVPY